MNRLTLINIIKSALLISGLAAVMLITSGCENSETYTAKHDQNLIGTWQCEQKLSRYEYNPEGGFRYSKPLHTLEFYDSGLVKYEFYDIYDTVKQIPDENNPNMIHIMLGEPVEERHEWQGTWKAKDGKINITINSSDSQPFNKKYESHYTITTSPEGVITLEFEDKIGPRTFDGPYSPINTNNE